MIGSVAPSFSGLHILLKVLVLIGLAGLSASCSDTGTRSSEKRFPEPDAIKRPDHLTERLRETTKPSNRESLALPPEIAKRSDTIAIGAPTRGPGPVFGEIVDVEVISPERIVVLDGQSKVLYVINWTTANVIQTIGGPGKGPGEFQLPTAVAIDGPSRRLYVSDAFGRLNIYTVSSGATPLTLTESVPVRRGIHDVCVGQGKIIAHMRGLLGEAAVEVYGVGASDTLELIRGLSNLYRWENRATEYRIKRGVMACSEQVGEVAFGGSLTGDIRLYDTEQGLLWIRTLEDFRTIPTYFRTDGGMTQVIPEDGGFSSGLALVITPAGKLVYQVATITRESRAQDLPWAELTTYVISADGRGQGKMETDWLIHHISETLFVGSQSLPYPRIFVVRADYDA